MPAYELLLERAAASATNHEVTEKPLRSFAWKIFRAKGRERPARGWKLHVTMALDESEEFFEKVVAALVRARASFKLPSNLAGVMQLNDGKGGPTQIGKVLTVYPETADEARRLLRMLDAAWPDSKGARVPDEGRLREESAVSARYGAFASAFAEDEFGRPERQMRGENGQLVEDRLGALNRDPTELDPELKVFTKTLQIEREIHHDGRRFLPLQLLRKGIKQVYYGIEVSSAEAVVLKSVPRGASSEAIENEYEMLTAIESLRPGAGIAPKPFALIEVDHEARRLLVVEDVGGEDLSKVSQERQLAALPRIARRMAELHELGVVHRDIKLDNATLSGDVVRLIDFETAARAGEPHAPRLGTLGHVAPEGSDSAAAPPYDIYALGVAIAHVLLQRSPSLIPDARPRFESLLRFKGVSEELISLVLDCTAHDPASRPTADEVAVRLERALEHGAFAATPAELPAACAPERLGETGRATRRYLDSAERGAWSNEHRNPDYRFEGINLGAAGIVLGLLTLDRVSGRAEFREDVMAAARWLASRAPQPRSQGLFTGNAGVALALAAVARKTGDAGLRSASLERLRSALEGVRETDLFSGAAGVIYATTLISGLSGDTGLLERAQPLVERLLATAELENGVLGWRNSGKLENARPELYTGAAHGAAGIAAALGAWAQKAAEPEVADFAVQIFKSIWASGRTPDGQGLRIYAKSDSPPAFKRAWCHGPAGYLWSILLAFGDEPRLASEIDGALALLNESRALENPTYCHGLSGDLELWRMLGAVERHRELAAQNARETVRALELLASERDGKRVWSSEDPLVFTPDLWVGFTGPATALALWHEGRAEALLSEQWLERL